MGIVNKSQLCYGVKVPLNIANKILIDKITIDSNELKLYESGNAYLDNLVYFICIKESSVITDFDSKCKIPSDSIIKDWHEKVLNWCVEHDINNPEIGWWLSLYTY
jgi:hypothetical protein